MDSVAIKTRFLFSAQFRQTILKINQKYRMIIQQELGTMLDKIRIHSVDFIEPNQTGNAIRNPYILRKLYNLR